MLVLGFAYPLNWLLQIHRASMLWCCGSCVTLCGAQSRLMMTLHQRLATSVSWPGVKLCHSGSLPVLLTSLTMTSNRLMARLSSLAHFILCFFSWWRLKGVYRSSEVWSVTCHMRSQCYMPPNTGECASP